MFSKRSRYYGLDKVTAKDPGGREVSAVRLRQLPSVSSREKAVTHGDKLDVMSQQRYGDGTRFWHIADANTELEAAELVAAAGRDIQMPER